MQDETASEWFTGLFMAVLGLIGLLMAGGARDIEISVFGFSLLGFSLAFIAGLMRRHFNDRARAAAIGRGHE
jgi:hypothetical protein